MSDDCTTTSLEEALQQVLDPSEGAGLGLPIVSLLCQSMGGGLRLGNLPGHGLRAEVVLPAA